MPTNNLPQTSEPANEEESVDSPPRDHTVTLSMTADDWAQLEGMLPALKVTLGRRVVPMAAAAYEVFKRGLELERAAA